MKTHCKRGHLLDGETLTFVNLGKANQRRVCRLCKSIRDRQTPRKSWHLAHGFKRTPLVLRRISEWEPLSRVFVELTPIHDVVASLELTPFEALVAKEEWQQERPFFLYRSHRLQPLPIFKGFNQELAA